MSMFQKATRKKSKLRLALCGPSGSGKTYTALTFAKELGSKIAVIDTEHGSASLYAGDVADFDVVDLADYGPREFIDTIRAAEREGYEVLVIDSLSHAWRGVLDEVDKAAARSKSGNSFTAWRDVTPLHNELVDTILASKLHIIVTMRSKTEWVLETNSKGKQVPRKIGMAPVQRDGVEYEFTIVGDMDDAHRLTVTKSRCSKVADAVVIKPDGQFARDVLEWLESGEAPPARPTAEEIDEVASLLTDLGVPEDAQEVRQRSIGKAAGKNKAIAAHELTQDEIRSVIVFLHAQVDKKREAEEAKAKADAKAEADRVEANEAAELAEEEGGDEPEAEAA